jgi:TRAP-type C4-dicarboxylate transport system permease small subunit
MDRGKTHLVQANNWIDKIGDTGWRGLNGFIVGLGVCAAVLTLALMFLTTADVVLRYLLGKPIKGAYEISEVLFLAAVFLGMAYTQQHGEHVRVEFFIKRLSPATAILLEIIMLCLAFLIYSLLTWKGFDAFVYAVKTGEYRWGLIRIPLWPARFTVSLGAGMLSLRILGEIVINIKKLTGTEKQEGA